MEEQKLRLRAFTGRLLKKIIPVLALIFSSKISARAPSWDYMWSLRFRQTQDTLFTASDSSFAVEIKNVTPDNVQISVNSLPESVSFVSSKKETVFMQTDTSDGPVITAGTRVVIWMKFAKTGVYKINPIDLIVEGGFYRVPFERIEVFENPRFIQPKVSMKIDNPKDCYRAGDHIEFTVCSQFAVSVHNIYWDIPENSLFKQTKIYEENIGGRARTEFSSEVYPLASFDWQPMKDGEIPLPEIYITASAYNGSTADYQCPKTNFKILGANEKKKAEKQKTEIFAYAFTEQKKNSEDRSQIMVLSQDILELLNLHKKERHSFPLISKAEKARAEKEISLGLPVSERLASVPLFLVSSLVCAICMLVATVGFLAKKRRTMAFFLAAGVLFSVSSSFLGYRLSIPYGIYRGGSMSPIPEKNIPSGVTVSSGTVVRIMQNAGGWMYIKSNDTYGWVPEEDVYRINGRPKN